MNTIAPPKFKRAYRRTPPSGRRGSRSRKKKSASPLVIALSALGGCAVIAGVVALSISSRPAEATTAPVARAKFLPPAADQEKTENRTRLALDCLAGFFGETTELARLASLRQYPGLGQTYSAHHKEILALSHLDPSPGGNLRQKDGYVGIPLAFPGKTERVAWVEIIGTTARVDLDSLIGLGDVPWANLATLPDGKEVFLRGFLNSVSEDDRHVEFISPDGFLTIRLSATPTSGLSRPRPARVTIRSEGSGAFHGKSWRVVKFHGWDWLHDTVTHTG